MPRPVKTPNDASFDRWGISLDQTVVLIKHRCSLVRFDGELDDGKLRTGADRLPRWPRPPLPRRYEQHGAHQADHGLLAPGVTAAAAREHEHRQDDLAQPLGRGQAPVHHAVPAGLQREAPRAAGEDESAQQRRFYHELQLPHVKLFPERCGATL
eukprot:6853537-Prymnesium_polylepis.1